MSVIGPEFVLARQTWKDQDVMSVDLVIMTWTGIIRTGARYAIVLERQQNASRVTGVSRQ